MPAALILLRGGDGSAGADGLQNFAEFYGN
jgi:hypothetical protein